MRKGKKKTHAEKAKAQRAPVVCFRCGASELIEVAAKCNDLCRLTRGGKTTWGYVPADIGLGSDENYAEFTYCRKCGQMQNEEFRAQ